jgi:hypothetical protein
MLLREIIAVYSENHMKPLNTLCPQSTELLMLKHVVQFYTYHCALKAGWSLFNQKGRITHERTWRNLHALKKRD